MFQRSPGLVLHWNESGLVCTDCASNRRFVIRPELVLLLNELDGKADAESVCRRRGDLGTTTEVRAALKALAQVGVIQTRSTRAWPWKTWMPEAALFHFGTRATAFPIDPLEHDRSLRSKAMAEPPPEPTKRAKGPRRRLPTPGRVNDLEAVLKARRTWRNFDRAPVSLQDLSTLLQLAFGVQRWGTVRGQGRIALKTSPSAGARHPIEAYVLAVKVSGLKAGAYHYDSAGHVLVDLKRTMSKRKLQSILGGQPHFAGAAAVVFMAGVFGREMWKYPSSRAYRAVLLDAGHLGQTFCLVATALGLAPFSTMAFIERDIDGLLRIDGVSESAIFAVGVGRPALNAAGRPGKISVRSL